MNQPPNKKLTTWKEFLAQRPGNAVQTDDLLREFILSDRVQLRLFPQGAHARRKVHILAERYGLGHVTVRVELKDLGILNISPNSLTNDQLDHLRKHGWTRRPANGCGNELFSFLCYSLTTYLVVQCCGWEYVCACVPMILTKPHKPIDLEALPSLRSLLKIQKTPGAVPARTANWLASLQECSADLPPLPPDVLALILCNLSIADALNARRVNKHWRAAIDKSATLWKTLYFDSKKKGKDAVGESKHGHTASAKFWREECLKLTTRYCTIDKYPCKGAVRHIHD